MTEQHSCQLLRQYQWKGFELKPKNTSNCKDAQWPLSDCQSNALKCRETQTGCFLVHHLETFEVLIALMSECWHCECWNTLLELNKKDLESTVQYQREGHEQVLMNSALYYRQQRHHPDTCQSSINISELAEHIIGMLVLRWRKTHALTVRKSHHCHHGLISFLQRLSLQCAKNLEMCTCDRSDDPFWHTQTTAYNAQIRSLTLTIWWAWKTPSISHWKPLYHSQDTTSYLSRKNQQSKTHFEQLQWRMRLNKLLQSNFQVVLAAKQSFHKCH